MLVDIGLMVGSYIFTRMLHISFKRESNAYGIVHASAIITILVTLYCCFDLVMHASQINGLLK
ncbi:MAG: hypothetical protein ABSG73_13160 [Candidatus Aminicenantales bacterium]|jgi:hypothetical protein